MSGKWTIEEDAILTRMAREGYSAVAISEIVGRSRKAVAQRAARLGLSLHGTKWRSAALAGEWPHADLEQAKAWWTTGVSSGEIAERLGRTRNSVIGKLRRAGIAKSGGYDDQHIERRLAAKRAAKAKRERERREQARIQRIALVAQEGTERKPQAQKETPRRQIPRVGDFTTRTVGYGQCRWIEDAIATADSFVCGAATAAGKSFCGDHHALVYNKLDPKKEDDTKRRALHLAASGA